YANRSAYPEAKRSSSPPNLLNQTKRHWHIGIARPLTHISAPPSDPLSPPSARVCNTPAARLPPTTTTRTRRSTGLWRRRRRACRTSGGSALTTPPPPPPRRSRLITSLGPRPF